MAVEAVPHTSSQTTVGTINDEDEAFLRSNGHAPVLRRGFHWLSALALGFSITNSWVGYLSNFGQNLIYGGPQVVIFGLIVAFFVQFTITLGLSELASAFPSAGGQYHICFIVAPPKHKRFAAFVVGWMSMLGWLVVISSGISLAALALVGLVEFLHPGFEAVAWQVWVIYCAVALITVLPLFLAPRKIGWTVQASLYLSLVGMVVTFITILATRQQSRPASWLTRPGLGTSGWSDGVAWLLGITNAMYAFGGTDGAIHISEEIQQPGRKVPQVMIVTMFVGILTSMPIMLILMLSMTDLEKVTAARLPSLEIIRQATDSDVATIVLVIWLVSVYISCLSSQWVTLGRIAWAFARDKGMPFAAYFSYIHPTLDFPVRTTVASFIFVCVYGSLYLASTTAFNSIITTAVLFLNITYAIPQGILLFGGREKLLSKRYLNLGWLGYFCNLFSILWIGVLGTLVCFPPSLPVTVEAMNYTAPILVAVFAIIMTCWALTGKRFEGPNVDWELLRPEDVAHTPG